MVKIRRGRGTTKSEEKGGSHVWIWKRGQEGYKKTKSFLDPVKK